MTKLIETYSGWVVCPMDGCGFRVEMKFARSEAEGSELFMAIVRIHGRFVHGSETYRKPDIRLVETGGIDKLARKRPERVN